jgi:hypothetical protein
MPIKLSITKSLEQLALSSDVTFTGPFTSESIMLHRAVFFDNYYTEFNFDHKAPTDETDWYYVRVLQTNESYAWSSPIWVTQASSSKTQDLRPKS